jgi:hypothetical protein
VLRDRELKRRAYWVARARAARIPTNSERGYGAAHQRLRAQVAQVVEAGAAVCARCGGWIAAGEPWDLDHTEDRTGYLGASHRACNRATSGRLKVRRQQGAARSVVSRVW